MLLKLYKLILSGPMFRGRHRLESMLKRLLAARWQWAPGGVRMVLDPLEWLQIELMGGNPSEPLTAELICNLLRPGDTYVDIGAHVGWLSLQAAKTVGPTGTVIAVDPQPYNCEKLLTNATVNGFRNITVVSGAIGEDNKSVHLFGQNQTDKARLSLAGSGVNDTMYSFVTQTYTLPALFDVLGLRRVNLLKVDVEGFELPIFRAATPVLERIDNIIFEFLPTQSFEELDYLKSILYQAGFGFRDVEGAPLTGRLFPENNIWACRTH